jgi:hypothetical protein
VSFVGGPIGTIVMPIAKKRIAALLKPLDEFRERIAYLYPVSMFLENT